MKEIEKLDMKEIRKLADKEYSIHEAKMGSLFVAASFKNPADKIKWDFTEGFIAGAKSQSVNEWVTISELTEIGKDVLGSHEDDGWISIVYLGTDNLIYNSFDNSCPCEPTHYMELPPPPQTIK